MYRLTWMIGAIVLAAMAASLWAEGAVVAALGAGAAALYGAVAAVRGRCFGDVCAPVPTGVGAHQDPARGERE